MQQTTQIHENWQPLSPSSPPSTYQNRHNGSVVTLTVNRNKHDHIVSYNVLYGDGEVTTIAEHIMTEKQARRIMHKWMQKHPEGGGR